MKHVNKWYVYNDAKVTEISNIVSNMAYILFYIRTDFVL